MTRYLKYFFVALFMFAGATVALGSVTFTVPTQTVNTHQNFTFFSATTTTATSTNTSDGGGYFKIAGAESVNLFFQRGDTTGQGNTGTSTFSVQVTPDGSSWYDYTHLQRVTNVTTGDTYFTRVANTNSGASVTNTGAATSTTVYRMDALGWYAVRCIVVEQTDGEHTCKASAEF